MTVPQLVGQAARFGFAVVRTPDGATLKPKRPDAALPPHLLSKFRDNRQAVIDWLDTAKRPPEPEPTPGEPMPADADECRVCRSLVDPTHAADVWAMCGRTPTKAGWSPVTWATVPAAAGCPYRPTEPTSGGGW